ncbi:MAG: MBL fold metallo-hydrolase [Bacteroidales bacterium]
MLQKIQILIDNRLSAASPALLKEHGLSIYFEVNQKGYLFDAGASGKFARNALELGVDLNNTEILFLSHGHNDHTGGLRRFLELNTTASVVVSKEVPESKCYTCRKEEKRAIGVDCRLFRNEDPRFIYLSESVMITPEIGVVFNKYKTHPVPLSNNTLSYEKEGKEQPDTFRHELALALKTNRGLVILSACSHNGVLNIIESCCEFMNTKKVDMFVGGTHLVEGDFETELQVRDFAIQLDRLYPDMELFTGHCTSDAAFNQLRSILGKRAVQFFSGFTLTF